MTAMRCRRPDIRCFGDGPPVPPALFPVFWLSTSPMLRPRIAGYHRENPVVFTVTRTSALWLRVGNIGKPVDRLH
jgi:hypothetical protein